MKNFKYIIIAMCVAIAACNKDKDESTGGNSGFTPGYLDQDLQGKIGGKTWIYNKGGVTTYPSWPISERFSHSFEIGDNTFSDSCANDSRKPKIIFSIDTTSKILDTGKYPLFQDPNDFFKNRSVTFYSYGYDPVFQDTTHMNNAATKGEYQILEIDTLNGIVIGRMNAYFDKNNFANGNFRISYCNF